MQTIQLVNHTPRAIEEVYVYPTGAANHGKSRATIAPNGSTSLQVPQGNVEVLAVSAKFQLDEHTRDRPSASQALELKGPVSVVFYDPGEKPTELGQRGVFGIEFQMPKTNRPPPPLTEPAQPASGEGDGDKAPAQ